MFNFAIIGCGRIAGRHAKNIREKGKLVAVCDIDRAKADSFAKEYNCQAFYSIDELLAANIQFDVIAVCTPNGFHAEHSIKSLQAGKHVLCEKPLCITNAAAWQMIETEKYTNRKLFVVKSARFNPLLKQVKKLIEDGSIGKPYSFHLNCVWNRPESYFNDWHGTLFPDGGSLYTQFSHYVDALIWLFGEAESVKGFRGKLAKKDIEFEDTGTASLKMLNGMIGSLSWTVNAYEKNAEIALTIVAEKATIILGGEYLNKIQYISSEKNIVLSEKDSTPNEYKNYKGSMSHHNEIYDNLIEALNTSTNELTGAFEGMQTVALIEKIYKSLPLE